MAQASISFRPFLTQPHLEAAICYKIYAFHRHGRSLVSNNNNNSTDSLGRQGFRDKTVVHMPDIQEGRSILEGQYCYRLSPRIKEKLDACGWRGANANDKR